MARGIKRSADTSQKKNNDDDGVDDGIEDDDEDDNDDDDDDDDEESKPASKKKKKVASFIDDAAEESGDDDNNDDEDDEDGDEDNNDYIKDGFVVDEDDEEIEKKKSADGLEDSDDDDDDDDDSVGKRKKRLKNIRKIRETDILDEDDLALIQENNYDPEAAARIAAKRRAEEEAKARVVAKNEADLRKGLFEEDDEEDITEIEEVSKKPKKKPTVPERYDEYGMDDFIEDDIGDQDAIRMADRKSGYADDDAGEVTEDQLNEASEIFGTDYLEFMQDDPDDEEEDLMGKKFRERGVGVSYNVDSDEEVISDEEDDDEDEDLFGNEEDEGMDSHQRAEALKLKREKRKLAKAERRRLALKKKSDRRKAQLRRAFEPVQLVENFCTERDDNIRQSDIPERFFDWDVSFFGSELDGLTEAENEQASWIASRIPELASEMALASDSPDTRRAIVQSIANALRFMHRDKLEPAFIKRYRRDYFPNLLVLEKLNEIKDEDGEWERIMNARSKVKILLDDINNAAVSDEFAGNDAQMLIDLKEELRSAEEKLDETAKQEVQLKAELEGMSGIDDNDDDELFGDDDDGEEKKKEKTTLSKHLSTIQSLLEARADKVSQLHARIKTIEAHNKALSDSGPVEKITKKITQHKLWNYSDYGEYLSMVTESRHILDLHGYLNLLKEGNDAIRKKELPMIDLKATSTERRRRSRRFDRDFYRTCVSEGLRSVCYQFLLAPNRAGIVLQDNVTKGGFEYTHAFDDEGDEDVHDPKRWIAPIISGKSPHEFANELVGSGELVLLSSSGGAEADAHESTDPLRGCRYVAAMELASEPRIRRYLREIYLKNAVLTTKPTKKGYEAIDAFHDYFGLHLIRQKPVTDHFLLAQDGTLSQKKRLSSSEKKEFHKKMTASCLQFLNLLKAERSGLISVHIHLPFLHSEHNWFDMENDKLFARDNQDTHAIWNELERVYLPQNEDTIDWNEERKKVLHFALMNFLLPHFEMEIRRDLVDTSMKVGVKVASESLREMAMEGRYRPTSILHTENKFLYPTGSLPIVGVCCGSDGKDATYLAAVNAKGETSDHLAIPPGSKFDVGKMRENVIMFLLKERPAAILVGTSGGFLSRMLQRKMGDLVNEAVQRWNNRHQQGEDEDDEAYEARQRSLKQFQTRGYYYDDDEDDDEWKCNVDLLNDEVPQLFGRSVRGRKEFPDYTTNLKIAISIARYARDPLGELTYTWSVASDAGVFGTEMLFLNIHSIQQLLPKTLLLREYERTLCEVVADVGVDLTQCCTADHLSGYLMFVAGLGPRKATNLRQTIKKMGGTISWRRDLLEKRLLGPIVYNNAVAFIRIEETDRDQMVHPLDETRLHPDVYLRNNWAVKIAFDALERDDPSTRDAATMKALRDVMDNSHAEIKRLFKESKAEWEKIYGPTFNVKDWNPRVDVPAEHWGDKVEELDLDAFADMIEKSGHGRWHSHLEMIKWEFRLPFADPRKPMEPLSGEKLFHLITGESDQSLRPGKEITGKVVSNGDFGSRVKLEGEIPAFIPLKNLSDDHVESADDYVAAGQIVTAIVTEVKKDHMTVDMSLKMEDFRKNPSSWPRPQSLSPFDDNFDHGASKRIEEANNKKREAHIEALQSALGNSVDKDGKSLKRGGRVVRRACTHPAFRNLNNDAVEREIREGGLAMIGEALIRPSSKSADSLAIHWIVKEGSVKVFEVTEEDKDTDASVGNILKIKGETYGSIDELLGRFVAPMNDFVEELLNHRKFMNMTDDEVDEKLKAQKRANPASIPYALCWMESHPGYGSLRFVTSTNARHHPIGLAPKGFVWLNNSYPSLDKLLNAFKVNPRGVSPKTKQPEPSYKAVAIPKPVSKNRWGAKAAPPPPQGAPPSGWNRPPPPMPPAAPVVHGAWGAPPAVPADWNQVAPPSRPPPPDLPPPPAYGIHPPPPPRPAPPSLPPPPPSVPIVEPILPDPIAFGMSRDAPSQGRGRGRTLPAWMSKG